MFRGAQHDFALNADLARRLRALAKAGGATLYMVLLAAFELLLHYHSGQEDVLVASPMVGRTRAEFEGIVGFFANPVVLRADFSGNPAFRAFLRQTRQTVLPDTAFGPTSTAAPRPQPTTTLPDHVRPR
jgi:non-ribosomal peptide synthetase component F